MSRDPHKEDKKQPSKQQQQAAVGHTAWELNRLSLTGRNFILEPDSRTSIVQELQMRLRREQQRREQMLQLSSLNNAEQDQSATSTQEGSASVPLPRQQQLGDEEQEVPVTPNAMRASLDSDARTPSTYNDAPEPVVTQRNSAFRNSAKKSSTFDSSAPGLESEPVTNQQSIATDDSAPDVGKTDLPQRMSFQSPIFSANDTTELELSAPAGSSSLIAADQESPTAYRNDSLSEDNRNKKSEISTRAVSNFTGEKPKASASWPTLRSIQQPAESSPPGEDSSLLGPPSTQRNSLRSETSLFSRQKNDGGISAIETADPSDTFTSVVGDDSTENGSLLPLRRNSSRSTHSTAVPATESVPMASPRRSSVRSAHSTVVAVQATEPMASPRRNSSRSETHTPAEYKAAGENARSTLSVRRDSVRSATTQTPADTGEKNSSQLQPSQPLRTPPCLQCLMRCLQDSGFLGSCWKAAVLELEEAFAIREVADAAIGKSIGGAGGESMQQRLPTQNRHSASGENSTVESSPQFEVNKWQALERLCHLRNSLRTCSHLCDA